MLQNFQFKITDYTLQDILCTDEKFLISTKNGDIIELGYRQKWETQSLYKLDASRVNYITRL
jgi:hypothetical protein